MVKVIAGAAGGPKWIVLNGMDRFFFGEWFKNRKEPLHMLGSSIGAWRFAATLSHKDPIKGLELFKEAYFSQKYEGKPPPGSVSDTAVKLMREFLNEETIRHMLNHPYGRLRMILSRCKGPLKNEQAWSQGLGLIAAASLNIIHRSLLGVVFDRLIMEDKRDRRFLFEEAPFSTQRAELTAENLENALLATGSIPMVLAGVDTLSGAPKGMYRDGGLLDYHMLYNYQMEEGEIVLLPHFFRTAKPGWFDKSLPYRKPSAAARKHMLFICPSETFIQKLPGGKVPDRKDFQLFDYQERRNRWQQAFDLSRPLGEELAELIDSGQIRDEVQLWE